MGHRNPFDRRAVEGGWQRFRHGKRHHPNVAALELHADQAVFRLHRQLSSGEYRPAPYRLLVVRDPNTRLVAASPSPTGPNRTGLRTEFHRSEKYASKLICRGFLLFSVHTLVGPIANTSMGISNCRTRLLYAHSTSLSAPNGALPWNTRHSATTANRRGRETPFRAGNRVPT